MENDWMNDGKTVQDDSVEVIYEYEVIMDDENSAYGKNERETRNDETETRPEKYAMVRKKDRKNLILLLILFIIFGIPAAGSVIGAGFSVLTGIISLVVGIFGGLLGLVFAAGAAAVALVCAGVALIISGCLSMAVPAAGVMMVGGGFLLLAVSVLVFAVAGWGCGTVIPGFVRFCAGAVKRCCSIIRKAIRRIVGKGGVKR